MKPTEPTKNSDLLSTPVGFARGVLEMPLYPWQERVLWDLDSPASVALRTANGSGKSSLIGAAAALWHAAVFPGSLCIITSGVFRQVKEQVFPAMRRQAGKFIGWKFNEADVEAANGSRILGFSTDDPGKAEGWHADNLLVIVDEAKSVPNYIFESIERCQPNRVLLMSSPGSCTGFFYEAFGERRKFYRHHVATALDCPHISAKWIEQQVEKYGAESPLIRSMIFAEFMKHGEDGSVIPLSMAEACLANPPQFKDDGTERAFCDFAAGGDENVFAVRRGNRVEIVAAWREKDTMRAVGQFIRHFGQQALAVRNIYADEGGLGKVMCDAMKEAGWNVNRVNNGGPARSEHYANRGAEQWFEGRTLIERREIILPNDKTLIAQLTTRRGWPNSRGKLELESKQELHARGVHSPDRADAVLGALTCAAYPFKCYMVKLSGF